MSEIRQPALIRLPLKVAYRLVEAVVLAPVVLCMAYVELRGALVKLKHAGSHHQEKWSDTQPGPVHHVPPRQ